MIGALHHTLLGRTNKGWDEHGM